MSHRRLLLISSLLALLVACNGSDDIAGCNNINMMPERLFLQQVSADRAIIKWRGAAEVVCVGTSPDALDIPVAATVTEGNHWEAEVIGLEAQTLYYYSVGGAASAPAGQWFRTAPEPGSVPASGKVTLWIVGDSGTATELDSEGVPEHPGEAEAVMQGFLSYQQATGAQPLDLFVMLGDNAYEVGSDSNYQGAVFDLYAEILNKAAVWPTIGNHEMGYGTLYNGDTPVYSSGGVSTASDPASYSDGDDTTVDSGLPYLDIFSLPTQGEAGGVASGTEQYYSLDYGNVHMVSLDSQLTARDDTARAAMKQWLIDDLSSNSADWTIVIFHHPPYSKGKNHDSDEAETFLFGLDIPQFYMRDEFITVFDEYGVDLVYSGHAHSYERSYYLTNHTGKSDTFDPLQHAELNSSNQPASGQGGESYSQISVGSGADDKAVYTVAGSSGKADAFPGGQHAAHYIGLAVLGSVLVDASASELTARFIDVNGDVLDYLTINR